MVIGIKNTQRRVKNKKTGTVRTIAVKSHHRKKAAPKKRK